LDFANLLSKFSPSLFFVLLNSKELETMGNVQVEIEKISNQKESIEEKGNVLRGIEEEIKNLQKLQEKYITVKTDFENKLKVANGYHHVC